MKGAPSLLKRHRSKTRESLDKSRCFPENPDIKTNAELNSALSPGVTCYTLFIIIVIIAKILL